MPRETICVWLYKQIAYLFAGNGGYGRLGHVKQQDEFKPRKIETFNQRVPVAPDVVSKLVSHLKATSTQHQRHSFIFSRLFCQSDCFSNLVHREVNGTMHQLKPAGATIQAAHVLCFAGFEHGTDASSSQARNEFWTHDQK